MVYYIQLLCSLSVVHRRRRAQRSESHHQYKVDCSSRLLAARLAILQGMNRNAIVLHWWSYRTHMFSIGSKFVACATMGHAHKVRAKAIRRRERLKSMLKNTESGPAVTQIDVVWTSGYIKIDIALWWRNWKRGSLDALFNPRVSMEGSTAVKQTVINLSAVPEASILIRCRAVTVRDYYSNLRLTTEVTGTSEGVKSHYAIQWSSIHRISGPLHTDGWTGAI